MTALNFNVSIDASAKKVWQVLWTDSTYRKWTSPFHEGSYAVTDWKEGSKVQFLGPGGNGMFSSITAAKPHELMDIKHLGEVKNFKEEPDSEGSKMWNGATETYILKEENGLTVLNVNLNSNIDEKNEFMAFFKGVFPKALDLVKQLAEQPLMITIEALVKTPVEKTWALWTTPEHIMKWNTASDDWHTPFAENDLRPGGKFLSRMEAKDGSFGFDFWGIYDAVQANERIAYTMGDGRKAEILYTGEDAATKIVVHFEAETENSVELQQGGWQSILNSFKKYAEAN